VHCTAGAQPIAISCLALFGRRPIERVAAIVFTGIQKPVQERSSLVRAVRMTEEEAAN